VTGMNRQETGREGTELPRQIFYIKLKKAKIKAI
jgi:hypothetical protein